MNMLDLAQWIIAAPFIGIFLIFLNELVLGLWPLADERLNGGAARVAVLIPAHNESAGIGATLIHLESVVPTGTRILVVADNCTDDTAMRARAANAEVVERSDPVDRGKGFALDFGRAQLGTDPPSCVIILDADCYPDPGTIAHLALQAASLGVPVQSVNLMRARHNPGPMVEISNFAFMIKNLIRQRGLIRSGGPAMLTGTGMAFPWAAFEKLPLASSNIVEDLAITVMLTRNGVRPRLVEGARVWSESAAAGDTLTQRTRWEHGFIGTARKHAFPALGAGLMQRRLALVRLGLHLLVPPLALLFALGSALLLSLGGIAALGGTPIPALLLLGAMSLSLALLAIAWWRDGRTLLSARSLVRIPLYIVWKIPVYLKLLKGAETEWVRTRRPD